MNDIYLCTMRFFGGFSGSSFSSTLHGSSIQCVCAATSALFLLMPRSLALALRSEAIFEFFTDEFVMSHVLSWSTVWVRFIVQC